MNVGPASPLAAVSIAATQPLTPLEPSAQQVARFQQQLESPASRAAPSQSEGLYLSPSASATANPGVDLQPLMHYAGQLSSQFQAQFNGMKANLDTRWLEPQQAAAVRALQDACRQMCQFGVTTLHFQFLTKGVQVTNDSARSLFQQA